MSSNLNFACPSDVLNKFTPSSSLTLKLQDLKDDRVEDMIGFDDGDIDDEIDPALKEKIDRFVCNYFGLLHDLQYNVIFFNFSG